MIVTNDNNVDAPEAAATSVFSNLLVSPSRKGSTKVTIQPAAPKTLTHLAHRDPVAIGFTDLVYTVQEGRKSSKYTSLYP